MYNLGYECYMLGKRRWLWIMIYWAHPGKWGFHMRIILSIPPVTRRLCLLHRSKVFTPLYMEKMVWSQGALDWGLLMLSDTFLGLPSHISLISFNCCSTLMDGRMQPWKKMSKIIVYVIYLKVIKLSSINSIKPWHIYWHVQNSSHAQRTRWQVTHSPFLCYGMLFKWD